MKKKNVNKLSMKMDGDKENVDGWLGVCVCRRVMQGNFFLIFSLISCWIYLDLVANILSIHYSKQAKKKKKKNKSSHQFLLSDILHALILFVFPEIIQQ